jgi:hypothetical protein
MVDVELCPVGGVVRVSYRFANNKFKAHTQCIENKIFIIFKTLSNTLTKRFSTRKNPRNAMMPVNHQTVLMGRIMI